MPPRTTKRRTTTNLKTKNTQNCRKIKLYGSPTTKELKKKHSSRPVGGAETGSQGTEDSQQGSGWQSGWSYICMRINPEECNRPCNPGFQLGETKPQNLCLKKYVGGEAARKTISLTGEFVGETHRALEHTQNHPPGNQHQRAQFVCG